MLIKASSWKSNAYKHTKIVIISVDWTMYLIIHDLVYQTRLISWDTLNVQCQIVFAIHWRRHIVNNQRPIECTLNHCKSLWCYAGISDDTRQPNLASPKEREEMNKSLTNLLIYSDVQSLCEKLQRSFQCETEFSNILALGPVGSIFWTQKILFFSHIGYILIYLCKWPPQNHCA